MTDNDRGQRINWLRRIANMTLDETSAATGISTPQLCGMELGKRTISDDQEACIKAVLLPQAKREIAYMDHLAEGVAVGG